MIAVLYKDNICYGFIEDVKYIEGKDIIGSTGDARGVTHDVLVTDDGMVRSEQVETARVGETIIYETRHCLSTSKGDFRPGGPFDPALFVDKRHLLGKTEEQLREKRAADLEMALANLFTKGAV